MTRRHYATLAINLIVGAAIMYLTMFTMIARLGEFFNNLNMLYIALTMAAPMGVIMLLTMRRMYATDASTYCCTLCSRCCSSRHSPACGRRASWATASSSAR